jgi:hypothetical protein
MISFFVLKGHATLAQGSILFSEKIFIEALEVDCPTQSHTNIVFDHEIGEALNR